MDRKDWNLEEKVKGRENIAREITQASLGEMLSIMSTFFVPENPSILPNRFFSFEVQQVKLKIAQKPDPHT
jgi:hypothetical protein